MIGSPAIMCLAKNKQTNKQTKTSISKDCIGCCVGPPGRVEMVKGTVQAQPGEKGQKGELGIGVKVTDLWCLF